MLTSEKEEIEKAIIDYDMAIKHLPEYAVSLPEFTVLYYNRGMLRLRLKHWEKAKSDLTIASNKGMDLVTLFHNSFISYASILDFEQKHRIKLPQDIAAMLTPPHT